MFDMLGGRVVRAAVEELPKATGLPRCIQGAELDDGTVCESPRRQTESSDEKHFPFGHWA